MMQGVQTVERESQKVRESETDHCLRIYFIHLVT
jgi:hypothetical protein